MGFERSLTYYLFARPSLLEGVSRTLDLNGNFDRYNESVNPNEADRCAIMNDWKMVGYDLQFAVKTYGEKIQREEKEKSTT